MIPFDKSRFQLLRMGFKMFGWVRFSPLLLLQIAIGARSLLTFKSCLDSVSFKDISINFQASDAIVSVASLCAPSLLLRSALLNRCSTVTCIHIHAYIFPLYLVACSTIAYYPYLYLYHKPKSLCDLILLLVRSRSNPIS